MHFFRQHNYYENSQVELLLSGQPFFEAFLREIDHAKESLHVQFYILDADHTGTKVIDALVNAGRRGVKVAIYVDGFASKKIGENRIKELRAAGVLFKRFSPIRIRGMAIGRRMHHKILIADGRYALVGGINISDRYNTVNGSVPWLDFAVGIRGAIVREIEWICISAWRRRKRLQLKMKMSPAQVLQRGIKAQILQNDWLKRRFEISSAYKWAIRNAKSEIVIVASYFLPGITMRRLLKKAQRRNVRIRLIVGKYSDIPIFDPALKYLYDWLLRNEIEVYEWQPSVLHGKLAIVDQSWVTVGSYNLNALSDYGSLELNVAVADNEFAIQTKKKIDELIAGGCSRVVRGEFDKRSNYLVRFWRWASYQTMRILFRLLFIIMNWKRIKF